MNEEQVDALVSKVEFKLSQLRFRWFIERFIAAWLVVVIIAWIAIVAL